MRSSASNKLFCASRTSKPERSPCICLLYTSTLAEIGGSGNPMILVFNKIDAYTYVEKAPDDLTPRTKENLTLEELMKTWMAKMEDNCLFISARERINIDELKNVVYQRVKELHVQKYPYNDFLYQTYEEEEE